MLAPVLALLLVFGVYPKILTDRIDPSTQAVDRHVDPQGQTHASRDVRSASSPTPWRVARRDRRAAAVDDPDARLRSPILPELILVGAGHHRPAVRGDRAPARTGRPSGDRRSLGLARRRGRRAASCGTGRATRTVLGGMVAADRFAVVARVSCSSRSPRSGCSTARTTSREIRAATRGEFYPLVLFATAGMTLIAASADLIVMFLALEILSLSLYVLTGHHRTGVASNEAAMKYFLLGAFSSAFFLYGVAMAYGATDTTQHHRRSRAPWPGRPATRRWRCWRSRSWPSGSRSRWRRCRSTCGRPTCTRARRPRSRRTCRRRRRPRRSWR